MIEYILPAAQIVGSALLLYVLLDILCRWHDRLRSLWRVRVWWGTHALTHWAKSEPEAREWAALYPVDAVVSIESTFHGRSTFVAGRNVTF